MKVIKNLQSEIYVPITPDTVWTAVEKPLEEMVVALVTAAGVHLKSDDRFHLAGDTSFRIVPGDGDSKDLMVSHGGYDNSDVNKDINCMFPIDRLRELVDEGFIKGVAPKHVGFMGGGGNIDVFEKETGPQIAEVLKEEGVDAVVMSGG